MSELASEGFKISTHWQVRKYHGDVTPDAEPYEVLEIPGNLLTYGGASAFWERLIGTGVTAFSNANSYLGVGDSTTAAAATQTDLQAATNFHWEPMDATYPQHTDGTTSPAASITYLATFETTDANFAWAEVGLANASDGGATTGRLLNRKVQAMGTKTSADSWILTLTMTLG